MFTVRYIFYFDVFSCKISILHRQWLIISEYLLMYIFRIRVEILTFVRNQLSQARLVQDQFRISQLTEVERCLNNLNEQMCKQIYQV